MASAAAAAIWWIYGCNKSEVRDWRNGQGELIFFLFSYLECRSQVACSPLCTSDISSLDSWSGYTPLLDDLYYVDSYKCRIHVPYVHRHMKALSSLLALWSTFVELVDDLLKVTSIKMKHCVKSSYHVECFGDAEVCVVRLRGTRCTKVRNWQLIEAWTTLDRRSGFLSWFATRVAETTLLFAWADFGYFVLNQGDDSETGNT